MRASAFAFSLLLALGACSHSPVANEHSLFPPLEEPRRVDANSVAQTDIVITSCVVPESIDRPQLVVTEPNGGVRIVENERWIEPLKLAISRTIAHDLTRSLTDVTVWSSPSAAPANAAVRLRIEVAAWESVPGRHARVDLLWHVHGNAASRSGHAEFVVPVEDASYATLVRAHRAALRKGSERIAHAVAQLLEAGR